MSFPYHRVEVHKHTKLKIWTWACSEPDCFAQGWENTQSGAFAHAKLHRKHTEVLSGFFDIFQTFFGEKRDDLPTTKTEVKDPEDWFKD